MKPDAIFKKYLTSTRRSQRLFKIFFLGVLPPGRRHRPYGFRLVEHRVYSSERPEAANSAVNYYVSCSIRPAVFLAGGWADT
jgi:hypothetical protein